MKDQNSVDEEESKEERLDRALSILLESLHKPDPALRNCAHNQKCYHELMMVRNHTLDYLHMLRREGLHHEWPIE